MRIAVCGDVHWSTISSIIRQRGNEYSERLENLITSVNWFENISKEYGCDLNIYLGDFFDRPDLNSQEISALTELKWNNNNKIFIVGNHEANLSSLDYSSTKVFNNINVQGVEIIDKVQTRSINDKLEFVFIPYTLFNESCDVSKFLNNNGKKKIIFSHNDLSDIKYGKFITTTGISADSILNNRDCLFFINGHLHNHLVIDNKIIMPGNLTGQNFNEDALRFKHLIYIFDISDNEISYNEIENPYGFKFYKLEVNDKSDLDKLDILNKLSVVSIACTKELYFTVEDKLKNLGVKNYKLYIVYNENKQLNVDQFKIDNHITQFIKYAQENLTPSEELSFELSRLGEVV